MRRTLLLLLTALLVACSGDSPTITTLGAPEPTGTLVLEHTPRSRALEPEMTHILLRAPDGTRSLPLGDSIRVDLPVSTKRIQLDYHAGDTAIGRWEGAIKLTEGGETRLDPPWVKLAQSHPVVNTFGADVEAIQTRVLPIALAPHLTPGTPAFTHNPPAPPSSFTAPGLPPIGQQGTTEVLGAPGTCIAWSFGYGLGGYTASRNRDGTPRHDITLPEYQPSPAFLFAVAIKLLKLTDCARSSDVYTHFMVFNGSGTLKDVQYVPDCDYIMGLNPDTEYPDRFNVRIGSYYEVPTSLALLQEFLSNGQVIAFAGILPTGFDTPAFDQFGVYSADAYGDDGHGMLLVGYQDGVGGGSENAFLIQNSFGTDWPPEGTGSAAPQGMILWNATNWLKHFTKGTVAFPANFDQPAGPELTSTPTGAPTAVIPAVTQVPYGQNTNLVLNHWFRFPVNLTTVALEDPNGVTMTQTLGDWGIQNGYTYFQRQDGQSFEPGTYTLTLTVIDGSGDTFTLTGPVTVSAPPSGWPQPTAGPIPATVLGTNLQPATVTP